MVLEYDVDIEYKEERYTSQKNKCYVFKHLKNNEYELEYWFNASTGLLVKEICIYIYT